MPSQKKCKKIKKNKYWGGKKHKFSKENKFSNQKKKNYYQKMKKK